MNNRINISDQIEPFLSNEAKELIKTVYMSIVDVQFIGMTVAVRKGDKVPTANYEEFAKIINMCVEHELISKGIVFFPMQEPYTSIVDDMDRYILRLYAYSQYSWTELNNRLGDLK